jgi:hypothetical protein
VDEDKISEELVDSLDPTDDASDSETDVVVYPVEDTVSLDSTVVEELSIVLVTVDSTVELSLVDST